MVQTYSFRVVDAMGNAKWVEINAVRVLWENSPATLNFFTEITIESGRRRSSSVVKAGFEASFESPRWGSGLLWVVSSRTPTRGFAG